MLAGNDKGVSIFHVNAPDRMKRNEDDYNNNNNNHNHGMRPTCGTKLIHNLDSMHGRSLTTEHDCSRSVVRIKSLCQGNAFAVGTNDGRFRIFTTEESAEVWASAQSDLTRGEVVTGSTRLTRDGCASLPFLNVTSVWQSPFAVRQYARFGGFSLAEQVARPTSSMIDKLSTCNEWPSRTTRLLYNSGWSTRGAWDFWESGSQLLAAHVGQERDYFGIRLYDDRCNDYSSHVVVDKENYRDDEDWNVETTCFLSERTLATYSANYYSPSNRLIKFWDIRNMRDCLPSSVILPSFPRESVVSHSPFLTHTMNDIHRYCKGDNIQALPDGNLLSWASCSVIAKKQHVTVVDPITGHTNSLFLRVQASGFTPAVTNAPSQVLGGLTGGNAGELTEFLIIDNSTNLRPVNRTSHKRKHSDDGNASGASDEREIVQDAEVSVSIKLDCTDEYDCHAEMNSLAMNLDGTMFVCASSSDNVIYVVDERQRVEAAEETQNDCESNDGNEEKP